MKIRPLLEMYNMDLCRRFAPGVIADVPEELAQEYIAAGSAVPVEEKARAEPTPDTEPVEEQPEVEEQPDAEKPKKPRTSKAKKTT